MQWELCFFCFWVMAAEDEADIQHRSMDALGAICAGEDSGQEG